MQYEHINWVEIGRYWVPEPARQRKYSLEMRGHLAKVEDEPNAQLGFVLKVPMEELEGATQVLQELYPSKKNDEARQAAAYQKLKAIGRRKMLMGGVLAATGAILSVGSFFSTDKWVGVVFYGTILVGLFLILTGYLQKK